MRGSIRQKHKGSWQIIIDTGTDGSGKRRRHFETIRGRKGDAQRRLTELLASIDRATYTPPSKLTVADLLRNWLQGYVKTNCSPRTLDSYTAIMEHHLIPPIGHYQLKQLTAQTIQAYYARACDRLSARTVYHQHRVVSQALKYAVRQGYLGRNPCELVDPPSPRGKLMRTLDPREANILLEVGEGSYYYPVIYTALSTGLRQAELLGLSWRGIDLGVIASISVNRVLFKRRGVCEFRQPKTSHSRRLVSMTPPLAEFLREYRWHRESLYHELGRELGLDDLVFASAEGKPVDPSVLSHNFARLVKRAGLRNVRFHDLRHTFASLALRQGIHPKIVSEALGHASVGFTMDVYSHIMQGMQTEAMARLGDILPRGRLCENSVAIPSPQLDIIGVSN